jgi:hypothetical protein
MSMRSGRQGAWFLVVVPLAMMWVASHFGVDWPLWVLVILILLVIT